MKPLIGISCNFFHPSNERDLFKNKRLTYHEQDLAALISRHGGIPLAIPFTGDIADLSFILERVHGLVLGGGSDVAPGSYGQEPKGAWLGDGYQDEYEIALVQKAFEDKLPVLGVCRGCQLLNVALGGTLCQDINTFMEGSRVHRDSDKYDQLTHPIQMKKGTRLQKMYNSTEGWVNSVHHQAVEKLGRGLQVNSESDDGVVEGIEWKEDTGWFALGVQWHPEWIQKQSNLLPASYLIDSFIAEASKRIS